MNTKIIELGEKICLTGCPENGWNHRLINKMYNSLIEASVNLIKANRNVNNLYPLNDIREASARIKKAEEELIFQLEEIGWENIL